MMKIAFIDDESSVLESVKWVFKGEPYDLFTFLNPVDALVQMENDEFAVVVADQVMPEMDGTELVRKISAINPETKCFIMTAHPENEGLKTSTEKIILKPWNVDELKSIVNEAAEIYEKESKRHSVIFVDDDRQMSALVEKMLKRLGYNAIITPWCSDALKLVESQPDKIDLVITDLKMPDMDGFELTQKLLEIRPDLPVILCTGLANLEEMGTIKEKGIREIILKPFLIADIERIVKQVLGE